MNRAKICEVVPAVVLRIISALTQLEPLNQVITTNSVFLKNLVIHTP